MKISRVIAVLLACVLAGEAAGLDRHNGFDVGNASIPRREILSGGPVRDGIPSIDRPEFVNAADASYLKADSRVIGLEYGGESRAYPISILNWHEVVNDRIGEQAVVVSFCPLCGTGMVFAVPGESDFGVSGLLYNSDVLLYDRQTESLWSQIMMQAVSGPRRGEKLRLLPASHTNWVDWQRRHPDTRVLSVQTGTTRDYQRDPYQGYGKSPDVMFPVAHKDRRYHPKEQVVGLVSGDIVKAWPFVELSKAGGVVSDRVEKQAVVVRFDAQARTASVYTASGEELPSVIAYWFAWMAFYPDTDVYRAP